VGATRDSNLLALRRCRDYYHYTTGAAPTNSPSLSPRTMESTKQSPSPGAHLSNPPRLPARLHPQLLPITTKPPLGLSPVNIPPPPIHTISPGSLIRVNRLSRLSSLGSLSKLSNPNTLSSLTRPSSQNRLSTLNSSDNRSGLARTPRWLRPLTPATPWRT
jgi:hypothetical protein